MRPSKYRKALLQCFAISLLSSPLMADDNPGKTRAPADYEVLKSDRAGAYFIAKPLKEKHDRLIRELAALRREISEARADPAAARRKLDQLATDLKALRLTIDQGKLYIPGAKVHTDSSSGTLKIASSDLLLIDSTNVEIHAWDGPEIRCMVEKTVLSTDDKDKGVPADLDAIKLELRRATGSELFGYYKDISTKPQFKDKPEFKAQWDRFALKEYIDRDFPYVTIRGLVGQEGNHQISLEMKNETGAGLHSSEWRRLAKLIVFVPKCQRVAVRGALAGFKVEGLHAPLFVLGEGDRDYEARYEISDHIGSLATENIPIHRLAGIQGDVSINATAYAGNVGTTHDQRGVTVEPGEIYSSTFRDIQGSFRGRFVRTDVSLEGITGQIDVENDFGRTTWTVDRPIGKKDHRLISMSGTIEVRLAADALGGLPLALYTECGIVHLDPGLDRNLDHSSFHATGGDGVYRSWSGFVSKKANPVERFESFDRVSAALRAEARPPGVDILSRGGTISLVPLK
jgi:hypothetical protein